MPLLVQPLNCTLKQTGESSTDAMLSLMAKDFERHGAKVAKTVRVAALNVMPGVTSNEGEGDDWPDIRKKIVSADILLLGGPVWMGQPSSVAKRVMERLDAFLGETDDKGRMPSYGKVAVCAVVGNEDGAHHICAEVFQALNDVGFTIPAIAACYWVGEAMGSVDFKDLKQTPKKVARTSAMVADNAVHLATLLKSKPFPGHED